MTPYRIIEVSCYAAVNLFPYILIALYAFRNRMRLSDNWIGLLVFLALMIQILTRLWGVYTGNGSTALISSIRLIAYLVLFLFTIKAHFGKIIFILFIFSNLSNLISICAHCLEVFFFGSMRHELFCWHTTLIVIFLHGVITIPFAFMVKQYIRPLIESTPVGNEWNYYWASPAVFYLIWQFQLYGSSMEMADVVRQPKTAFFLFTVNLGGFLIYYMTIQLRLKSHPD